MNEMVYWTSGKRIPDERGSFTEVLRNSGVQAYGGPPIQQINISKSHEGVLRGIHWHKHQWDYWHVTVGKLQVVIHEPKTGKIASKVIGINEGVWIPPRYGHGFLALAESVLLYGVTEEYNLAAPDEQGYHPYSIGAPWIMSEGGVTMSERDSKAKAWSKP